MRNEAPRSVAKGRRVMTNEATLAILIIVRYLIVVINIPGFTIKLEFDRRASVRHLPSFVC